MPGAAEHHSTKEEQDEGQRAASGHLLTLRETESFNSTKRRCSPRLASQSQFCCQTARELRVRRTVPRSVICQTANRTSTGGVQTRTRWVEYRLFGQLPLQSSRSAAE